jgi:hypothetical protein
MAPDVDGVVLHRYLLARLATTYRTYSWVGGIGFRDHKNFLGGSLGVLNARRRRHSSDSGMPLSRDEVLG